MPIGKVGVHVCGGFCGGGDRVWQWERGWRGGAAPYLSWWAVSSSSIPLTILLGVAGLLLLSVSMASTVHPRYTGWVGGSRD